MVTGEECTEYFPISTPIFFRDREDAVEFVEDTLTSFEPGCPLTITIARARYEDSYVITVIAGSSEDTQAVNSFVTQLTTSNMDTPDGSSQ